MIYSSLYITLILTHDLDMIQTMQKVDYRFVSLYCEIAIRDRKFAQFFFLNKKIFSQLFVILIFFHLNADAVMTEHSTPSTCFLVNASWQCCKMIDRPHLAFLVYTIWMAVAEF